MPPLVALLAAALGWGAGWALAPAPAVAGAPACVELRNEAPFWVPGHLEGAARRPTAFRLGAGERRRLCLAGALHPGGEVRLILKNALGLTVQDCRVAAGRPVVITAEKLDKGWRVAARCR